MKAWYRGEIQDAEQLRISVLDHGLLYGDGVFEGIRITQGRVFCLDAHLQRLFRSAQSIGLDIGKEPGEIREIVLNTAAAFARKEAYVRILVTRGPGPLGLDPTLCQAPELICLVAELRLFNDAQAGVSLMTSSYRRNRSDMVDPQVKSLNYLNNVLAKREAVLNGYDDALMLNESGHVVEASGANIFAVIDGKLKTPPTSDGALPGITRGALIELAEDIGGVTETSLTRYDILHADEVFLCGSAAGVVIVRSVDKLNMQRTEQKITGNLFREVQHYVSKVGIAVLPELSLIR
ncbi:MAG: aminotransferase class IV [Pseudomonadota bacterium]